jgi:opacity protein-like surface antigen
MTRQFVTLGLLLLLPATALAQSPNLSISAFDPNQQTAPIDMVEGAGVKVGEGTTLFPVFGAQTGVVSNVFYQDTDTVAAGMLRLSAQVGAGSLTGLRLVPAEVTPGAEQPKGSFEYRAELRLAYDFLLSSNDAVWDTGGLGIGATLRGMTNPGGTWSFGFSENFTRLIRAANFETDANTNRDINALSLNLLYHPQARSLAVNTYYNNTLDIFEQSEQSFANRWMHRFGVRPMWRWLPETVVYGDFSWGYISALGSSMKSSSYPLTLVAGIATLFTPKITLNLQGGYVNGFYTTAPSYSSATASAQIGYRYTPLGRATIAYNLLYTDSVNANYFRDHVITLNIEQLFAPFVFVAQPEVHFRTYEGTIVTGTDGENVRNDIIFAVIAGLHYNFRNSLAATLDYNFSTVQTNFNYMVDGIIDDPSYMRHQLMAGVRWAP